jgi:hypothetical protein
MTTRINKLTHKNMWKYRRYDEPYLKCVNCGKILQEGDWMVTRLSTRAWRYCLPCAVKLHLVPTQWEHVFARIVLGKSPIPAKGEKALA